jgi:N-methylhydantoinase A
MSGYYVGVDIGGTFTDIVAVNEDTGDLTVRKVPSTPPTFIEGILSGLGELDFGFSDIRLFVHGSTIATNAVIERKGAHTALITTKGFRDVLLVARATKPDTYDLRWRPGAPVVRRRDIFDVTERIDYEGAVVEPLAEDEIRALKPKLEKRGIEAVAISFLNSFVNPEHERRAKEIVEEMCPGLLVSTSYEVYPEIREFERTSTTAVNAYLRPLVDRYLGDLLDALRDGGFGGDVLVVHSGGGVMSDASARRIPARTCYSGPSGGVMGGAYIGTLSGFRDVITMDMGGTSCDVAVVKEGRPLTSPGLALEHNIPIRFPSIDVQTIGAGGGSISWIDRGILKNGPHSAGASPGPACYDRGGTLPTNSDANLALGRLSEAGLIGGRLPLRRDLAEEAIRTHVALHFDWTVEEAASSIIRVANANMINAIRLVTIQQGHDPRDFALVAFGGAGPLHAVEVARELNVPRVVVPLFPGLASAFGQLHVDLRHDLTRAVFQRESQVDVDAFNGAWADLESEARALLTEEGIAGDRISLERQADLKYFPQSFYLTLPVPMGKLTSDHVADLVAAYNERHMHEFGYTIPRHAAEVEIGQVRLVATGLIDKPSLRAAETNGGGKGNANGGHAREFREVYYAEEGWIDSAVYRREELLPGMQVDGPAVVDQFDSTTLLPPGASASVDAYQNLIVDVG